MNVILDVVSPVFLLKEAAVKVLPYLLLILLLVVSIVVIRLVLKKNRREGSSRPQTHTFEIPENNANDD